MQMHIIKVYLLLLVTVVINANAHYQSVHAFTCNRSN
jgi:hypothetical protein